MKEYTLFAVISVFVTFFLDICLKTVVLKKKRFWFFLSVIIAFKLLVNGYLTANKIVTYNPQMFSGFRLGSIPAEDFLFGFSMVGTSIILWNYFKSKGL